MRLLVDPPLDGPTNMARDELLLDRVGTGSSPPTLRLYQWDPPTISLGYFQHYTDYERLPLPAGALSVVRRQTGGGAILHDLELTYSLTLPIEHPLISNGANRLYELAHDAILACLATVDIDAARCGASDDSGAARGPFFCFERRHCYDLLIGKDKIAGSAQRRTRQAVLQHGSIVLANRFPQQPSAFVATQDSTPGARYGPDDYSVPAAPDWFFQRVENLRESLPDHFARVLGLTIVSGTWQTQELSAAVSLTDKHSGEEWIRRS